MDLLRQTAKKTYRAKFLFDGEKLLENKYITLKEGKVIEIQDVLNLENLSEIEDLGEGVISPGFIDLQLNGCGGVAFTEDITQTTLEIMYQTQIKYGTTSFLPTIITSQFESVLKGL